MVFLFRSRSPFERHGGGRDSAFEIPLAADPTSATNPRLKCVPTVHKSDSGKGGVLAKVWDKAVLEVRKPQIYAWASPRSYLQWQMEFVSYHDRANPVESSRVFFFCLRFRLCNFFSFLRPFTLFV